MNNVWFSSDHHFGHSNILEYEKERRPFSCLDEMHEVMIERWNSVVKKQDKVYHLGDFAFGSKNIQFASSLNGRKILVMGNHDVYPSKLYLEHFDKLYGMVHYKRMVLSHIPVHESFLGSRWLLNVHGHTHSNNIKDKTGNTDINYFNVSVEQNNLTPIHLDIIMKRIDEIND